MDSPNAEFLQKPNGLEWRWDEIAKTCNAQPGFHDWFTRNKAATILQTMIKPVRQEASLESPPEAFTMNASEIVNSIIKSSQLMELTENLKEAIDEEKRTWQLFSVLGLHVLYSDLPRSCAVIFSCFGRTPYSFQSPVQRLQRAIQTCVLCKLYACWTIKDNSLPTIVAQSMLHTPAWVTSTTAP